MRTPLLSAIEWNAKVCVKPPPLWFSFEATYWRAICSVYMKHLRLWIAFLVGICWNDVQYSHGKESLHIIAISMKLYPITSLYGIFTYIYHKKSTIHVGNIIAVPWMVWVLPFRTVRTKIPEAKFHPSSLTQLDESHMFWEIPKKTP